MVIASVGVGLVLAFFQFLYMPSTGEVNRLRMDVNKYGVMESKKSILLQSRLNKTRMLKERTQEIDEIKAGFLAEGSQGTFMKKLRELVAGAEFQEESVITGGIKHKGELDFLSFAVSLKGPFEDVYGFIRSLEDLEKFVWLDRMYINRTANSLDGLVELNLNLSVPLLVAKEE